MAKANYHQIRRQKELARKTRQQEKQQKRQALKGDEPTSEVTAAELTDSGAESTIPSDGQVADSTVTGGQGSTGS